MKEVVIAGTEDGAVAFAPNEPARTGFAHAGGRAARQAAARSDPAHRYGEEIDDFLVGCATAWANSGPTAAGSHFHGQPAEEHCGQVRRSAVRLVHGRVQVGFMEIVRSSPTSFCARLRAHDAGGDGPEQRGQGAARPNMTFFSPEYQHWT